MPEYADILEAESADAGQCPECGEHLDSGRCDCLRCDECGEYLDGENGVQVTVENVQTKQPVQIMVCEGCAIKLAPTV